jgi:putative addiction module component (TIGR02574 family)
MVARNIIQDLLSLPVTERLEIFERLRENLLNDPELHPITETEKQLLDERLAEYEADPDAGSPWEEVEARLLSLVKG